MKLRQMLERLIRRRDPSADRRLAAARTERSDQLVEANRAVLDDLRVMERDIRGRQS